MKRINKLIALEGKLKFHKQEYLDLDIGNKHEYQQIILAWQFRSRNHSISKLIPTELGEYYFLTDGEYI